MKLFLIAAVMPAIIFAHSKGPEPRRTGAPGDNGVSQSPLGPTCASCHTGTPGTGSVQISAAEGSTYTPGQKQRITVTINATPAARVYGFQATARLVSDLSNGQAGALESSNSETFVICEDDQKAPCRDSAPVQFVEHNAPKTNNSFEFDWTPPADASAGDVRFYVAANAANGDGRDGNGDRVFTANVTLSPAASGGGGPKPAISNNGVVNGATFTAGIVSGSWATIQGTDLAQTTRIWQGTDFNNGQAPTELDGVKVSVDGKAAAVYYISSTQINVQVPTLDRTGSLPVEVTTKNGTSNTASADARRAAPGWFMFDPENRKYIAGTQADGTFLGKAGLFGTAVTTRPAKPGDVITLYGANFGPTNPAIPAGRAVASLSPLVDTPSISIGGANATVQYGGGAPNLIGTYQFNIVVPDVPNGDQPVVVQFSDGSKTQDNAFITIQR